MILSHEHRFIFVKTRKTAGSSIERCLHGYLGTTDVCSGSTTDGTPQQNVPEEFVLHGHQGWRQISETWPEEWQTYYKFAVERNPWDKMASMYHWYKHSKPHKIKNMDFNQWIKSVPLKRFNDWNSYHDGKELKVDHVIRFEDLHSEMSEIPVPYDNELSDIHLKSGLWDGNYVDLYDSESRDRVGESFEDVINYFGFRFPYRNS